MKSARSPSMLSMISSEGVVVTALL
jgi:hypothetical protein